jgi:hypothetical protein
MIMSGKRDPKDNSTTGRQESRVKEKIYIQNKAEICIIEQEKEGQLSQTNLKCTQLCYDIVTNRYLDHSDSSSHSRDL